jgi:hypothetical protein
MRQSNVLACVLDAETLDPRAWDDFPEWRRVFLSERNDRLFAIVDRQEYDFAQQFSWACHKQGGWRYPNYYARRTAGRNEDVSHGTPFYLHVEIMKLVAPSPSPNHTIADHRNGNTLDCRRCNLRWVTLTENRANRHGFWRGRGPEQAWNGWKEAS